MRETISLQSSSRARRPCQKRRKGHSVLRSLGLYSCLFPLHTGFVVTPTLFEASRLLKVLALLTRFGDFSFTGE